MAFPTPETLKVLIEPVVVSHGMDVERIRVNRAGSKSVVAIAVDSDTHPDLDTLEALSNEISLVLDTAEEAGQVSFGAGYTLEVSTPGVDHPLTLPRHWRRNVGRLVALTDAAGATIRGRIGALNTNGDHVILITRNGKKLDIQAVELAAYPKAVVEVEFAEIPAAERQLAESTYDDSLAWREEHK
ncbi:ribosome maturation factor RimP [Corynebacterium freiburgense]|uniref:ribosome maturation factor RimP n=1 Tax=Corynebacterium freiburgense TaxID=556548 RepID=UPI00040CE0CE|nr:ribosome maturation factor RimP [Corynebacterium freiburgense]WJZ02965.1 Ribosome maturation factor RimP [Corynebacterium freiburgense]